LKRVIAFAACVLALTFGSLLHRGWVEMSVVDPDMDPTASGAVYGWGWPLEFFADGPVPFQNGSLGSGDIFLVRPFLFDLLAFSLIVGVVVLLPVVYRRLRLTTIIV
jgi:hypothetical protein